MIRFARSVCLVAASVLSVAVATAAETGKGGSDVDALATLLSQDVILGSTAVRRPAGAQCFMAAKKLGGLLGSGGRGGGEGDERAGGPAHGAGVRPDACDESAGGEP